MKQQRLNQKSNKAKLSETFDGSRFGVPMCCNSRQRQPSHNAVMATLIVKSGTVFDVDQTTHS
eukprot:1058024-Amphidinium_carterae.1